MKKIIFMLLLVSSSAFSATTNCVVETYSHNPRVLQMLELQTYGNGSVKIVGEDTAEVHVSYQDKEFTICIMSEISESATSVCTKGSAPNLIFNGKVISCSL